MRYRIYYLFLFIFLFLQCTEEKPENTALLVIVESDHTAFGSAGRVSSATIRLDAQNIVQTTNKSGSFLFENLPMGEVEITVEHELLQSSTKTVRIDGYELKRDTIFLYQKDTPSNPAYTLFIEESLPVYNTETPIIASLGINHQVKLPLTINVTSSLDGVVCEQLHENSSKQISLKPFLLTAGHHQLTFDITDVNNQTSVFKRQIAVYNALEVNLTEAKRLKWGEVQLKWNTNMGDEFGRIEVYRLDLWYEKIAEVYNPGQDFFIDDQIPLCKETQYMVRAYDKAGRIKESEILTVANPSGRIYDFEPLFLTIHPRKPILLGQHRDRYGLVSLNWAGEFFISNEMFSRYFKGLTVFDQQHEGQVLVNKGDGVLIWFDMETLLEKKRLNVEQTGFTPKSVAALDGSKILVSYSKSDPNGVYRVYDTNTGQQTGSDILEPISSMMKDPSRNRIIGDCSSTSSYSFISMEFSSEGILTDSYRVSGKNTLHNNTLAPNGEYLVSRYRGTVYKTNRSFEIAGALYDRDSELYRLQDQVISDDSKFIFCCVKGSRKIKVFEYPGLREAGVIVTKGFPARLFLQNGKLISQSLISEYNNSLWGVEIFDVKSFIR